MGTLGGMVAIVPGASSGIGEGIAGVHSVEGVKVALVARRRAELERVAADLRRQGGTAVVAPADLRDEQALTAVVEQAEEALGPVDILVNGGGVIYVAPIHEMEMRA